MNNIQCDYCNNKATYSETNPYIFEETALSHRMANRHVCDEKKCRESFENEEYPRQLFSRLKINMGKPPIK